jgi:hypothetical protein
LLPSITRATALDRRAPGPAPLSDHAAITGGIAIAFSVASASIFAALTPRLVDQWLVLAGYRPSGLLLGRVVLLELFGILVAALFSVAMVLGTEAPHPWRSLAVSSW